MTPKVLDNVQVKITHMHTICIPEAQISLHDDPFELLIFGKVH